MAMDSWRAGETLAKNDVQWTLGWVLSPQQSCSTTLSILVFGIHAYG